MCTVSRFIHGSKRPCCQTQLLRNTDNHGCCHIASSSAEEEEEEEKKKKD